jgi:hypothetical protein
MTSKSSSAVWDWPMMRWSLPSAICCCTSTATARMAVTSMSFTPSPEAARAAKTWTPEGTRRARPSSSGGKASSLSCLLAWISTGTARGKRFRREARSWE